MYNDVIQLVSYSKEIDEYGDVSTVRICKEAFAKVMSIGQSEFYQAQASGLKPEIKFAIADYYEYDDEREIIYENKIYKVLKTYRKDIELEITCYGGVNIERAEECN